MFPDEYEDMLLTQERIKREKRRVIDAVEVPTPDDADKERASAELALRADTQLLLKGKR